MLGEGGKGTAYVLRREADPEGTWLARLFEPGPEAYTFQLPDRDESGGRALSELREQGVNLVANAVAQSVEHIVSFFVMLRTELAFYVGCLNLRAQLSYHGSSFCFPQASEPGAQTRSAVGPYDVCLALSIGDAVVGNDFAADGKTLVVITGANQGGKSTFLRAVGLAQLMMQSGMFVAATVFRAEVCARLLTHYKREEDASMRSGKFDEELSRMSAIVDVVLPTSMHVPHSTNAGYLNHPDFGLDSWIFASWYATFHVASAQRTCSK